MKRRKKQLFMVMLCAFSMLLNSAAVVAQSKDKRQEPKSGVQQAPEALVDFFWVGEQAQEPLFNVALPAQDPAFNIRVAAPGQDRIAFTPARQVEFIHNEFSFDNKLVKDAPYSADVINETIQTLGDGNRIVRNSSSKIYRDSAGRTRREQSVNVVGPWAVAGDTPKIIFINDPVSGVNYNLNPNTKTANKMPAPRVNILSADSKEGAELKAKLKEKMKATRGADANSGVVTSVFTQSVNGAVTTATATAGGASGFAFPAGDRVFSWSSEADVNRESLGTQTIEGVEAEGTRVTFTIPAGKIGNERPIITVNEQWYSPELQSVVMSKNSDPRMGETTYRLTNIVRSEPDPSLFQVPSDYTVSDNGFRFGFDGKPPDVIRGLEIERKAKKPNEN